jgi:hypothetical protein
MKKLLMFLTLVVTFTWLTSFCDNDKCKARCAKKIQWNSPHKNNGDVLSLSPLSHISQL